MGYIPKLTSQNVVENSAIPKINAIAAMASPQDNQISNIMNQTYPSPLVRIDIFAKLTKPKKKTRKKD